MLSMKQCPDCSSQYGDEIGFCLKDGKALVIASQSRARLCPHCANSIQDDAVKCPYCKAELSATYLPQWPGRSDSSATTAVRTAPLSLKSKAILIGGIIVFALGVFLIGSHQQRGEIREREAASLQQLRERELKIQALEVRLKQSLQDLEESKTQIAVLTAKLQESRKELSTAQQRLSNASREAARPAAGRPPAPAARSAAPAAVRRPASPGVYEVIRPTTVHEEPSARARAVAMIGKGTKITVISASGEWLEVRSRQGKPPGFIRLDDAMFVRGAN